jgi:hypothetical protein
MVLFEHICPAIALGFSARATGLNHCLSCRARVQSLACNGRAVLNLAGEVLQSVIDCFVLKEAIGWKLDVLAGGDPAGAALLCRGASTQCSVEVDALSGCGE